MLTPAESLQISSSEAKLIWQSLRWKRWRRSELENATFFSTYYFMQWPDFLHFSHKLPQKTEKQLNWAQWSVFPPSQLEQRKPVTIQTLWVTVDWLKLIKLCTSCQWNNRIMHVEVYKNVIFGFLVFGLIGMFSLLSYFIADFDLHMEEKRFQPSTTGYYNQR